ncbi:hypothetical protein ACB092_06G158200 [Castanea dentata]
MSTYLPEDVVLKILSMLPAKSLLRFRRVCKSWLFLIGAPDFLSNNLFNHSIINNTTTNTTPHQLLLVKRTVESTPRTQTHSYHTLALLSQTVLDLPQTPHEPKIVGSCNGLLCLFDHDIFVYNPATSELKALPPAPYVDNVCYGFDSKRNEFKVMRIRYVPIREPPVLQTDREVQVLRLNRVAEVYSLNSGCSWRKLINVVDNDEVPCSSTPSWAYANGVCFWCGFNDEKVVAFDVSNEKRHRCWMLLALLGIALSMGGLSRC